MEDYKISKTMPTSGKFVRIHQYQSDVFATSFKWDSGALYKYLDNDDEWYPAVPEAVKNMTPNVVNISYVSTQKRGAWLKFNEKGKIKDSLYEFGKDASGIPEGYVWCEEE